MAEQLVFDQATAVASSYKGPAGRALASFRGPPEQVGSVGIASQAFSVLVPALKGQGADLLKLRIWADAAPTLYTRYRIEITARNPAIAQQGQAAMSAPFPFLIVGAALLALGFVALTAWNVQQIDWGSVGSGLPLLLAAAVLLLLLSRKR